MKGGDCTKDFQKKKSQIAPKHQKFKFLVKKVRIIFK